MYNAKGVQRWCPEDDLVRQNEWDFERHRWKMKSFQAEGIHKVNAQKWYIPAHTQQIAMSVLSFTKLQGPKKQR